MLQLTHPIVDVAITCSNFEESLRFYHECLGLEIVLDIQIPEEVAKGQDWHRVDFAKFVCKPGRRSLS